MTQRDDEYAVHALAGLRSGNVSYKDWLTAFLNKLPFYPFEVTTTNRIRPERVNGLTPRCRSANGATKGVRIWRFEREDERTAFMNEYKDHVLSHRIVEKT